MARFLKLVFVLTLAVVCLADNLIYMRVDSSVIEKRLEPVPATEQDRINTLRAQFKSAGCAPDLLQEQTVPDEELPNLICMVPGQDPGAIVVGTRLQSKAKGEEAVVDWGGPVMLPLLVESLNSAPHHQTFIFVAFAGHEHGMAGASYFLKQLNDAQRGQIDAMIQLEKVGRTPAVYGFPGPDTSRVATAGRRSVAMSSGHPPTTLSKVLPLAAASLKLAEAPQQNNDISATEARVFEDASIASIVIHSPSYTVINTPGKAEPVHMSRTAIDPKSYTDTYNLMCVYLLYLDKVYFMTHAKAAATQTAQAGAETNSNGATVAGNAVADAGESSSNIKSGVNSASAPRPAQPTPVAEGDPGNPVFRTTTRLVQVDVVVTDKQGKPMPGLAASDFTILQDGKPQRVSVFEPHAGDLQADKTDVARSAPRLPPNTYTNQPGAATADSWTILLFDLLNTPPTDQQYARKELIDMLRSFPKGKPVAVYMLTDRLVMVQGFTDDPEKLVQAAEKLRPNKSALLTTEAQRQQEEGRITNATAELVSSAPAGTTTDNPLLSDMNSMKQQQIRDQQSFQIADRANFTLAAFEALSRAVSGYPGRKNLIWLSAGFPIQLMADPTQQNDPWRNSKNFQAALAEAGTLLAKSRIAVYPTDVRGLEGRGVDITVSASESGEWTKASNGPNYGNLIGQQTAAYADDRKTMKEVADQTGGEAFMGSNDLKAAMRRSLDDGSTYYTLAYTPDKTDSQTAFHKIEVKVDKPDTKLAYRRGYYSTGQKAPKAEIGAAALRGALQPGMPPSTMVFFTAQVLPPDEKSKDVRIVYIVNPNSVTFADVPDDKKHIVLDCMAIAYDKEGREVAHSSDTLEGAIQKAAYETVMTHGVPAQQQIALPPGAYNLRLGVMDRSSQQIGTVDVPLVVPETTAAKK
ncbi:MAG TPA: VWA domain-containing protein [Candidatus Angelobacter sp.]|nr:VWA domain-containing protein [Candidatus Angelobacter sp.]